MTCTLSHVLQRSEKDDWELFMKEPKLCLMFRRKNGPGIGNGKMIVVMEVGLEVVGRRLNPLSWRLSWKRLRLMVARALRLFIVFVRTLKAIMRCFEKVLAEDKVSFRRLLNAPLRT